MSTWIPNTDDNKTSLARATLSESVRDRICRSTDLRPEGGGWHLGLSLRPDSSKKVRFNPESGLKVDLLGRVAEYGIDIGPQERSLETLCLEQAAQLLHISTDCLLRKAKAVKKRST
jgi:hypothetical protein